jgi:hypothetical protein
MRTLSDTFEKYKSVYRVLWAWQDEKCERWLNKMSLDGWHLVGVNYYPGIKFHFVKGEPKNYIYKFDTKSVFTRKLDVDYLEIYENAGWEFLCQDILSNYFRKEYVPGDSNDIYTDNNSKANKYKKLLMMLYGALVIEFLCLLDEVIVFSSLLRKNSPHYKVPMLFSFMILGFICLVTYGIYKIRWKIRGLRSPLE